MGEGWLRKLGGAAALLLVAACGGDKGSSGDGGSDGGGIPLPDSGDDPSAADGEGGAGPKLDVGDGAASGGGGDCPGGDGGMPGDEFSLIWIANSPEGTVSKIDTRTGMELARYYTGPTEGNDDPSRTSVNLVGDVAVTNRGGGIMKIAGHIESCRDLNGNGDIETSQGMNDVLPFGTDECVLWHQPLPGDGDNRHGPRPTAWDAGEDGPCGAGDERLWVGWWDYPTNTGRFRRLAGSNGEILDEVDVPDWDLLGGSNYGPYGGAINAEGDLWVIGLFQNLVKIDGETLEVERWDVPEGSSPYGIALDANGDPWTAGWDGVVLHFDPDTEQFTEIAVGGRRLRGLQVDREGVAWVAANNPCGAVSVDTTTKTLLNDTIALPGCQGPVGVSIDIDGNVWLPDREANLAFKLNPADFSTTTTTGLLGPYTYSDMTGAGLGLVVNPPAG